eukprot:g1246.t2
MASEISQISQVAPFGVPASPASGSRVPQAFASQPQMASDISQISQVRPFGTAGCGACSATPGASPAERLASELSQISQVTPFGALPPTAGLSSGGLFEAPATTSLPPTVPPSPIGSMMSQWPTEQVLPMPSGVQGMPSQGPQPLPVQNLQATGHRELRPATSRPGGAGEGWMADMALRPGRARGSRTGQTMGRYADARAFPAEASPFPNARSPREAPMGPGPMQQMPMHMSQMPQMQYPELQRLEEQRQMEMQVGHPRGRTREGGEQMGLFQDELVRPGRGKPSAR